MWRYRWPLVITAAIVISAVFSLPPLVNAAQPSALVAATLRRPMGYYLIAPASNILDALTLLAPPQIWMTFASCAVFFLILCARRHARSRNGFTVGKTIRALLGFTGGAVAVEGIARVAWPPKASLVVGAVVLLTAAVPNHTSASHAGRSGFDPESNRDSD